jgi:hypothetical protein
MVAVSPHGGAVVGGTAPLGFTVGAAPAQVASDIVIEWDFDNDGDFDEDVENLHGYVMAAETLTGRDYPSSLTGKAGPGQLKLTLLNNDDRFSFFNTSSPLNQAPNSLRTGRKIRIRTTTATDVDPVLLARDRFNGTSGVLSGTDAETGQAWIDRFPTVIDDVTGQFEIVDQVVAVDLDTDVGAMATVDVGQPDHYAQVLIASFGDIANKAGLVVRYTNDSNFSYCYLWFDGLHVFDVAAGTEIAKGFYGFTPWDGCVVGLGVTGDVLTGYVNGVPVTEETISDPQTGDLAGIYAHCDNLVAPPRLDDFHVWDRVAAEIAGCLWTGEVSDVQPDVQVGATKVAELTGEGVLIGAALAEVASPRVVDHLVGLAVGAPTGLLVGDTLARAGLLHPPVPLDVGSVTTGPVGIDDGKALEIARLFEDVERGFLHETAEGQVGFQDQTARAGASSEAWFSDTPGVGQYPFSGISPYDQRSQIVNQVTAGVAAEAPGTVVLTTTSGTQHVDITLPTTVAGDLLVIFIAGSHAPATDLWQEPLWWTRHRNAGRNRGMRIYSHFCDGTESGTVVRFFDNPAALTGLWAANVYRIQGWYLSTSGLALGEIVQTETPSPIVPGWGRAPTLFLLARSGIRSLTGGSFTDPVRPPVGYIGLGGTWVSGGDPLFEAAILSHHKIDISESEAPVTFPALNGFTWEESVLFAVRGFNGPHTKATLQDPRTTGGDGRFVTVDDVDSQDEHNATRSNPSVPVLFASEADAEAYCDGVLAEFADDRPIVELSFYATSSAALRDQAVSRRVGHKVTVTANGDTGLGIERDFFIENIGHQWSNAAKLWQCTWQLSPA